MKKSKNFFFNQESIKKLKLDENQMKTVFGGLAETHTKTIKYDRYTTYSESTHVPTPSY
jgi:hypothetical protein